MKASSFDLWSPVRILTALVLALALLFVGLFVSVRAASYVPRALSNFVVLIIYAPFLGGMFYLLFAQYTKSLSAGAKKKLRYALSADKLTIETKPTPQEYRNMDVREISRSFWGNKLNVTVGGHPLGLPARVDLIHPEGLSGGIGTYGLAVDNSRLVIKFWSQPNDALVEEILPF